MKRIEYRTTDKSAWGEGPWQHEPDKVEWEDEDTSYRCIILRGPMGSLCGYVGIPNTHPLYGNKYSQCPINCGEVHCDHSPECVLEVHGGITFSATGAILTYESYQTAVASLPHHKAQSKGFPHGDSAQWVKEWEPHLSSYEHWLAYAVTQYLCETNPTNAWFFGFDCAHAGDICPKMNEYDKTIGGGIRALIGKMGGVYRTLDYVTNECKNLAKQLKEWK